MKCTIAGIEPQSVSILMSFLHIRRKKQNTGRNDRTRDKHKDLTIPLEISLSHADNFRYYLQSA